MYPAVFCFCVQKLFGIYCGGYHRGCFYSVYTSRPRKPRTAPWGAYSSSTGREPANGWHSFRLRGGLFRLGVVFYTLPVPSTGHIVPPTTFPVPPTTLPVPSTTFPVPSTGQFIATPRSAARIRPNAASIRRRSEPIRTYTERSRPRPPTYLTRLGAYPTAHRTDPNLHGT